jgi:hypothetical protein
VPSWKNPVVHVDRVVPVVRPLRRQPVAARFAREDHHRIVQVALGDERQRPAEVRAQRVGALGELLQEVHGAAGRLVQRMDGIQTETVDVVVAHPAEGVVEDVVAHRPLVEVEARSPGVALRVAQVRSELRQIVAAGSEVVVDDVLDDGETGGMGRVDEALVRLGPAVVLLHGIPEHAVVAPVAGAVEGRHRQQLDMGDAEPDQMIEPARRRVEGPLGGEGAHVQLVDQPACQLPSRPRAIGPGEGCRLVPGRQVVHSARLPPRAGVRAGRLPVAEHEAVLVARCEHGVGTPPAGILGQLDVVVPRAAQPHAGRGGSPYLDHSAPPASRPVGTRSATG